MKNFLMQRSTLSFTLSLLCILSICYFFIPRFETNDDVGMSMIAHGYGIAAFSSPNLVFSNVLWGYFVRLIPSIDNVLGYSIATMSVIFIAFWCVFYGLLRARISYLLGFIITLLIFFRPMLFPQFTINAGLLAVAGIFLLKIFEKNKNLFSLGLSSVLIFFSFLIRSQECLLLMFIALPILPWKLFCNDKLTQAGLLTCVIAILIASGINYYAYQNAEWHSWISTSNILMIYLDYGAINQLIQHPEILKHFGYSINDLLLIMNWFFADSSLISPSRLNNMFAALHHTKIFSQNIELMMSSIGTLMEIKLFPLTLLALGNLLIFLNRKLLGMWCLAIITLAAMGILGRASVVRVDLPILALLILVPFLQFDLASYKQKILIIFLIIASTLINCKQLIVESHFSTQLIHNIQKQIQPLIAAHNNFITFGTSFPYEYAFPVFSQDLPLRQFHFYSLGSFTLAPFSFAYQQVLQGNGLIQQLRSETGATFFNPSLYVGFLQRYCKEHFDEELSILKIVTSGSYQLVTLECGKGDQPVALTNKGNN